MCWSLVSICGICQNAPISTISVINSYSNTATVPVTAINFTNIGSFNLDITYDQAIVQPVSVTTGPLLGGNMSVNLTNPGSILLSWYTYPGLTLSGNPVILNINFTMVALGTSTLNWSDNGYSCAWYDGNFNILNDVPTATYYIPGSLSFNSPDAPHTLAPVVTSCMGEIINVPIKVTGFNNIGAVALTLNYNASALTYQSFTNNSGFPGLTVDGSQPGTLLITGTIPSNGSGFSLPDSSILVTGIFNFSSGNSNLSWYDNGTSCQYSGSPPDYFILNDDPQSTYYIDGSVTGISLPGSAGTISGPQGGNVCKGQSGVNFIVSPIQNATTYVWAMPAGATITGGEWTNSIIVTFDSTAGNGDIIVYGNNICGNGQNSPPFTVIINSPPTITSQPVSPDTVDAGAGTASFTVGATGSLLTYQWQVFQSSWNNLSNDSVFSGVYSPVLTIINPPSSMNGTHYRCIVSGFCQPQAITDGDAMLSVRTVTGMENKGTNENDDNKILILNVNPNPAVSALTISYFLPAGGHIVLEIRNIVGEKIKELFNDYEMTGSHNLKIFPELNPGVYLVTLTLQTLTEENIKVKKFILL